MNVLAHAGSEMHNQQATYIAAKFDNVFLEPSWVGVLGVQSMIKKVGCSKILFSSDNIYNIPVEMAKYRSLLKKEEDLERYGGRKVSLRGLYGPASDADQPAMRRLERSRFRSACFGRPLRASLASHAPVPSRPVACQRLRVLFDASIIGDVGRLWAAWPGPQTSQSRSE